MYKSLIAGITALSLTMATAPSTQAQGLTEEQIGQLLFGLVATVAVGSIINNRQSKPEKIETPKPHSWSPKPRTPRNLMQGAQQNWQPQRPQRDYPRRDVPAQCLTTYETRQGKARIFARGCMSENYRHFADLPRSCAVRIMTHSGPKGGWDPQCLRTAGYTVNFRH